MKKPDISIIIVNYNVRDFMVNCLDSLLKSLQNYESEIFVVDNASSDDSIEVIRKLYPRVNLIANKDNLGFAKGNNIALKQAAGKYILLLNPDTILSEDTISVGINWLNEHPEASIMGCKTLNADGTLQIACRRSFPTPWIAFTRLAGLSRIFPRTKLFGKYNLTYLHPDESTQVEAIGGSFMLFRREVYDDIGGLDETFFMYGEDLDWLFRANKKGWKTFYVPSTRIIHYKGESTRRSKINAANNFYGAMHLFVKKHYNSPFLIFILRMGIFCKSSLSFILNKILSFNKEIPKEFSRIMIAGYTEEDKKHLLKLLPGIGICIGRLSVSENDEQNDDESCQVLGKLADMDKIVEKYRVETVLFSTHAMDYANIINTIEKSGLKHVDFGLIPRY